VKGITDDKGKQACVQQLVDAAKKPFTPEKQAIQTFGMLTVGNIGCDLDLSMFKNAILNDIAIPAFTSGSDEIRTSAKFMLGSVTNGSIASYIPAIDSWAQKASEGDQYYVLATLQEFATRLVESNNRNSAEHEGETIVGIVKSLIREEDEGKRNVAWDCLGKLSALAPSKICPAIITMASDKSKELRTIAAGAVRVMYSHLVGNKISASWQTDNYPVITRFIFDNAAVLFGLLKDDEVQVRRQILLTTNYLLRQKSTALIPDELLKSVVAPSILRETEIRPELIIEIQIGPHKDIQDNGLESRKAAYGCLSTLLEAYPDVLGIEDVLSHLAKGFKDNYDIVLAAIQICIKLVNSSFTCMNMIQHVDKELIPAVDGILFPTAASKKPSADELERLADEKKNVMYLVALMKNIPGIFTLSPAFGTLVNTRIVSDSILSAMLKECEQSTK